MWEQWNTLVSYFHKTLVACTATAGHQEREKYPGGVAARTETQPDARWVHSLLGHCAGRGSSDPPCFLPHLFLLLVAPWILTHIMLAPSRLTHGSSSSPRFYFSHEKPACCIMTSLQLSGSRDIQGNRGGRAHILLPKTCFAKSSASSSWRKIATLATI